MTTPAVPETETNAYAVYSLVLGVLWLLFIGSILAVIYGHLALSQIKKAEGRQTGRGMAIAGLVLGYIGVAILTLMFVSYSLR